MLVRLAHPYGGFGPGVVLDLPDEEALLLVAAGLAVAADEGTPAPAPRSIVPAAEIAADAAENLPAATLQAALEYLAADAAEVRAALDTTVVAAATGDGKPV